MVDILTAAMGAKMASGAVQSQIDTALSSVYKYKGQCTNSELASKTKTAGDVWEITDSGTYAAGTDVVCDGTNWAAMTGHLHVNVVDDLTTQSATDALSANMGYALAQAIASAGGGGTWSVRQADNNWYDIFEEREDGHIVPLKDLIIKYTNIIAFDLKKGIDYTSDIVGTSGSILSPVISTTKDYGTTDQFRTIQIYLQYSDLKSTSNSISTYGQRYTISVQNDAVTVTLANMGGSLSKGSLVILIKD